jgi:hypothetical protein
MCLNCKLASALFIGPELTTIYNDAMIPTQGEKHKFFGSNHKELWPEVHEQMKGIYDQVCNNRGRL